MSTKRTCDKAQRTLFLANPKINPLVSKPVSNDKLVEALKAVAEHSGIVLADFAALIPDSCVLDPDLPNQNFVSTGAEKYDLYDDFFEVKRINNATQDNLAIAFLKSLKTASIEAKTGTDIGVIGEATMCVAIRAQARLLIKGGF